MTQQKQGTKAHAKRLHVKDATGRRRMVSIEDYLIDEIGSLGFDLHTFLRPEIDEIIDSEELSYEIRKLILEKLRSAERSSVSLERDPIADFTFADFFAGIGGFRIALESLGGTCVAFSEIDKQAVKVYKDNFETEGEAELGDIQQVSELPVRPDLIVGGVPCQSWSIAGKNRGFEDPRGELWGDAVRIIELNQPAAFIFENVKGLADPRHRKEREYLVQRFHEAGYETWVGVLDSLHFGVPQSRKRIYFVGFKSQAHRDTFARLFRKISNKEFVPVHESAPKKPLYRTLINVSALDHQTNEKGQFELFANGNGPTVNSTRITNGAYDYFIFNDIRNGGATIHSWDLAEVTDFEKRVCLTILENRRSREYGPRDGNPMALQHITALAPESPVFVEETLEELVQKGILLKVRYNLTEERKLKDNEESGEGARIEWRYEFANSRISSGIRVADYVPGLPREDIIYRIFLPDALAFGTLTASGSKDFIALHPIEASTPEETKERFIQEILKKRNYRQLTKREQARLQGFPDTFKLHETESVSNRQMGNAVSVPVIQALGRAIIQVGVLSSVEMMETAEAA